MGLGVLRLQRDEHAPPALSDFSGELLALREALLAPLIELLSGLRGAAEVVQLLLLQALLVREIFHLPRHFAAHLVRVFLHAHRQLLLLGHD